MTEVKEETVEQKSADVPPSGTVAHKKEGKAKKKESASTAHPGGRGREQGRGQKAASLQSKATAEDVSADKQDKPVDAAQDKPVVEGKTAEFIDWIEGISVLELSHLVKTLEDRFGVTAAAPVGTAPVVAGEAGGQTKAEEKTDFDVVLTEIGGQKIAVIKEVRAITGLGLKDSKDLVEATPKPIKEGVSKEQAEQIKSKIEAVGGSVEIK